MTVGAALVAVVCFAVALDKLGVLAVARRAVNSGREATNVLRDPVMGDDRKEREVRVLSIVLLRCFGSITIRSAAAAGASLVPLWLLHAAGLVRLSAVNDLLMSWRGLLLASGAILAVYVARTRL